MNNLHDALMDTPLVQGIYGLMDRLEGLPNRLTCAFKGHVPKKIEVAGDWEILRCERCRGLVAELTPEALDRRVNATLSKLMKDMARSMQNELERRIMGWE